MHRLVPIRSKLPLLNDQGNIKSDDSIINQLNFPQRESFTYQVGQSQQQSRETSLLLESLALQEETLRVEQRKNEEHRGVIARLLREIEVASLTTSGLYEKIRSLQRQAEEKSRERARLEESTSLLRSKLKQSSEQSSLSPFGVS